MTLSIVQGDLFDPDHNFDALAQGVNPYGLMGAGIAVPFREKYPEMYVEYASLCAKYGLHLAGTVHIWESPPTSTQFLRRTEEHGEAVIPMFEVVLGTTIYNLFSQTAPGKNGDYNLLLKAAISMRQDAESQGFARVGLPWIGCGIAGLERHNVQHILEYVLGDSEIEFIIVEQP